MHQARSLVYIQMNPHSVGKVFCDTVTPWVYRLTLVNLGIPLSGFVLSTPVHSGVALVELEYEFDAVIKVYRRSCIGTSSRP